MAIPVGDPHSRVHGPAAAVLPGAHLAGGGGVEMAVFTSQRRPRWRSWSRTRAVAESSRWAAGSALLMNIYYRLGYDIVYKCGRPKGMTVKGMLMGDATLQWLHDNGFPTEPGRTVLLLSADPDSAVINAPDPGVAMGDYMGKHGTKMFSDMLKALQKRQRSATTTATTIPI